MSLLKISCFGGNERNVTEGEIFEGTFKELAEIYSECQQGKKHDGYWVRGELEPFHRKNDNLKSSELLVLDGDKSLADPDSAPPPIQIHKYLKFKNISHFIYTSHSHSNKCNKYRVVIHCDLPSKVWLKPTAWRICDELNREGIPFKYVKEMGVWSQPWFIPRRDNPEDGLFEYFFHFGDKYTGTSVQPSEKAGQVDSTAVHSAEHATTVERIRQIQSGEVFHDNLVALSWGFLNDGMHPTVVQATLEGIMSACPVKDERWESRLKDIPRYIADAIPKQIEIREDEISTSESKGERFTKLLPEKVLAPDDLYGELIKDFYDTMWKPNLMAAHIAADGIISYMAGGKYCGMSKKDRVNLQEAGIGDSGDGKGIMVEAPIEAIQYLQAEGNHKLQKAHLGIQSRFGSAEAIEEKFIALESRPDILFTCDEFGLALIEASKDSTSHKAKIFNVALEYWATSYQVHSQRGLVGNSKDIKQYQAPHLTIIGAGTEESLIKGVRMEFYEYGHGARTLLFPITPYAEDPIEQPEDLIFSEPLKKNLIDMYCNDIKSNIYTSETMRVRSPVQVKWDKEVSKYFHEIALEVNKCEAGSMRKIISNRMVVQIKKKAMIRAIVNNPSAPELTLEMAQWSFELCTYSVEYQLFLFKDKIAEGEFDRAVQSVLSKLRGSEGKWVTLNILHYLNPMRKLNGSRSKNDVLDYLVNTLGTVEKHEHKNQRGRPSIMFRIVKSD